MRRLVSLELCENMEDNNHNYINLLFRTVRVKTGVGNSTRKSQSNVLHIPLLFPIFTLHITYNIFSFLICFWLKL